MQSALKLKHYREAAGFTQPDLAKATGIPLGTIRDWEQTGRSPRDTTRLLPLADALGCSVDDLLGRTTPANAITPKPVQGVLVPIYGRVPAGTPLEMIESSGEAEIPISIREQHPYSYFLIVVGDSMDNQVLDGHLALIDPNEEVHNGDVAVVNVNGYDATLKVWHKTSNSVVLSPDSTNAEHKDIVIDETDPGAPNLRVLGKMVWSMAPYHG